MLVNKDDQLLACLPSLIHIRCSQSNQLNDVYYYYEDENWREWVGMKLKAGSQIWVDKDNPWRE
jgi:hypothetical protein